jgi:hypothetical protein
MLSKSCGVQFSRSRTVKMPRSSRQLVVRTVKPISAVLISKRSCMILAASSDLLNGMRVRAMGSVPFQRTFEMDRGREGDHKLHPHRLAREGRQYNAPARSASAKGEKITKK